jgi:hypothetical protein
MYNIILSGGFLRMSCPSVHVKLVNIGLMASPYWLNGILIVDKNPYYRLSPSIDNYIEIKNIKDHYYLAINERVIYHNSNSFQYTIDVLLNKDMAKFPYSNFLKYY